jgi:drug/metabolite transporter (DMT)-like permease
VRTMPAASPPTSPRSRWQRAIPGAVGMVIVGSGVGVSHALTAAPLFMAQAIRYTAAVPIVLVIARLAKVRIVRPRGWEWAWLAGIAATGLVLFNVAVVRGVAHAEPALIAVAVACVPVLLGVIGPLLQGQAPSRRVVTAAAVVTAGGALVEGVGRTDVTGAAWAAVALGCEAAFTLLAVPVLSRHGAWGVSFHSIWMGAVMFGVAGLVVEGPGAVGRLSGSDWAAMAYLSVFSTVIAFLLWYSTVATLGPARVGLLAGIAPISAAITGMIGGDGTPSAFVWAGMAVVIIGLAVGLRASWQPTRRHWRFPRGGRQLPRVESGPLTAKVEL